MDSFSGAIFRLLLWVAGFGAIVAGILLAFFVRLAVTSEDNMAPALLAGERIVIWRDAHLDLGDIAVCKHPSRDQFVIGRVIAEAGMTLSTDRNGTYLVNGGRPEVRTEGTMDFIDQRSGHRSTVSWGYIAYAGNEHTWMTRPRDKLRIAPTKISSGIYLLSDNRSYFGGDSRSFGEIDPSTCLGQVFFRLQPAFPTRDDVVHGWLEIVR